MEPLPEPVPVEIAEPAPAEAPPPDAPGLPEGAPAEERLHLARERARHGDWVGTRLVLEPIAHDSTPEGFTARYLGALSVEYEGRLDEALAAWDGLMAEDPTADVRFRRAETLGKLGRYGEARAALADLGLGRKDVGAVDRVKVQALDGIWDLRGGNAKRGEKHLRALVDAPASDEPTFYLAQARLALLEAAAQRADGLSFTGSDRKRAKNLEARAALVLEEEHQLADLIRLGETRQALDGFVLVAGTYLSLGDDLFAEPVPTGLTAAQAEIYREELGKKVQGVWTKSSLYCDKGLEYAARQDWSADPIGALEAARDTATARVEGSMP